MALFKKKQLNLDKLREMSFSSEGEMQKITEKNLEEIFDLEFVGSEISLNNLRIDTLAFDKEISSFVIIEFKNTKKFSVIDQGYAYLSLLLNNKADFILEYNERLNKTMSKKAVDWSQSKIMFVAPGYTKYQRQAMNFQDIAFELWEIKKYENDLIYFNQLTVSETSESIKTVTKSNETVKRVNREIKVYSEEYHLDNKPDEIKELYEEIKERILDIGENITIKPRKYYVGFKKSTNFVDIEIQKSQLKIFLNLKKGELEDPHGIARDMTDLGHWGNGDYEVKIKPNGDLDYLMTLIKQSYKRNN